MYPAMYTTYYTTYYTPWYCTLGTPCYRPVRAVHAGLLATVGCGTALGSRVGNTMGRSLSGSQGG